MLRKLTPDLLDQMRLTCGSANLRHVERIITAYYDRALKPTGITATQLPLLSAIGYESLRSISALADIVHLERTTVSRELASLKRKKLITAAAAGDDRRAMTLSLTPAGRVALNASYRAWQRAHDALLSAYGADAFEKFLAEMREIGRAVKTLPAPSSRKSR